MNTTTANHNTGAENFKANEGNASLDGRVEQLSRSAHEAVDRAAEAARSTAEAVAGQGEKLRHTQERVSAGASEFMREKPLQAMGVAAIAGFVLARLMSR